MIGKIVSISIMRIIENFSRIVICTIQFYLTNNKSLYLIYSDFFSPSRLMCKGISANLHSEKIIQKHQWMNHGEHH